MATQLLEPKESASDTALNGKNSAFKSGTKESYVIYSIYYSNEPEGGYVVYSNDQGGWEFFGYLPASEPSQVSQHQISHSKRRLL